MIVLDENVIESQRRTLLHQRVRLRQIGIEIGRKGLSDRDILPLLLRLKNPTFFTRDVDYYDRTLCHSRYCLVVLEIGDVEVARFARRVLSHPALSTNAKRMGKVIRAGESGMTVWSTNAIALSHLAWPVETRHRSS